MLLPRNSYLLTHQAEATPNTRLSGTEMPTAISVSLSAARASGSKIASKKVPKPSFSASLTTITSGSSRNSANTSQAEMISNRRPRALPRRAALAEVLAVAVSETEDMATSLRVRDAALQQVDQQQQDEGHHQHQHADGRGAGVVVLVQLDHDQQRQDLGFHRHVAGNEDHRAVLADAAGKGQGETGQPGRQ